MFWPAPVEIHNQQLLTSQPPGLPIVVFACQLYEQKQNSPSRPLLSILAIDKRTGREVFRKNIPNSSGVFHVVGNVEQKTVSMMTPNQTIALTFTDKPLLSPEQAAEKKKSEQPKDKTYRALFKSIEKSMGQLLGLPADKEEDGEELGPGQ